ncbi:MAG: Uma2 family endonuclease [Blastocatellia bacterium]|nr:Uma2 family endonuclease [Blastocatellia bacterium]
MSAEPKHSYTLEEYLELERDSEIRYEYWDGQVFAMSGASPEHEQILVNLISELKNQLKSRPCRVFSSNLRVKVPQYPPYRYPDLTALCDKPEYEEIGGVKTLTNPSLIVEILSPSTEAFDRGDKFSYYKSIPSFHEYLLLAQHRPHATLFVKQSATEWIQTEANDLTGSLYVPSIDCTLHLSEIFQNVEFETTPQHPPLPLF